MAYRLKNSIIKNPAGQIKFKQLSEDSYEYYHVGVWLEADSEMEMNRVDSVTYQLHPTFPKRDRTSSNRENDFSITFWSWGTFEIVAKIHLVGHSEGDFVEVSHNLKYDLPDDDGTNYIKLT